MKIGERQLQFDTHLLSEFHVRDVPDKCCYFMPTNLNIINIEIKVMVLMICPQARGFVSARHNCELQ